VEIAMTKRFLVLMLAVVASAPLAANDPAKRERGNDLQSMQGKWQLVERESFFATDGPIKEYLPEYKRELEVVRIERNQLLVNSKRQPMAIANDLRLPDVRVKSGNHLICFTFEDGRAMLGSYRLQGNKLEIRVPETCECTRTGIIATFERIED
jgi:hypothetical protein